MKNNPAKVIITICCLSVALMSCGVSGQVGDTFNFHRTAKEVASAIDTLYAKYPQYKVPAKWAANNNPPLSKSGYLKNLFFYFSDKPEEMYCVTLIDDSVMSRDSARTGLAVRAINQGGKWLLESDMSYKDERRIEKRFNKEIIAKLEEYTHSKVRKED